MMNDDRGEPPENKVEDYIRDRSDAQMYMRPRIPVAILGATGSVGQRLIQLLHKHPWFDLVAITASDKSAGKKYRDAATWMLATPIPEEAAKLTLLPTDAELPCKIVFSALTSSIAGPIETQFAERGCVVISCASAHRKSPNVPMIIPEVNMDQLEMVKAQGFPNGGMIVTKPNCNVIGLCLALRPLQLEFGLEAVDVVTMQSISGAGFPGVPSLSIIDNIIPSLPEEEEKVENETVKVLGCSFAISASCTRVPVTEGHLELVSVKLKQKATIDQVKRAFREFVPPVQEMQLPSSPREVIHYFEELDYPQPKLHRDFEKGMCVAIGGLRQCPLFDYKCTVLSHNTIRGAAGGAILTAELLVKKGFVFW
ncbi:MAG TPA: aspartate-semialdehyde dehydrogenase [Chlamydiales bacterium]|nr:aspartate-semialdehyde dehydrogenase [Chlamydiales bacterium]